MDYLKEGIGLRAAMATIRWSNQREGYDMFMAMLDGMKEESGRLPVPASPWRRSPPHQFGAEPAGLPNSPPRPQPPRSNAARWRARKSSKYAPRGVASGSPALTYSGPAEDGSAQVQRNGSGAKTPTRCRPVASRRERRPPPPRRQAAKSSEALARRLQMGCIGFSVPEVTSRHRAPALYTPICTAGVR